MRSLINEYEIYMTKFVSYLRAASFSLPFLPPTIQSEFLPRLCVCIVCNSYGVSMLQHDDDLDAVNYVDIAGEQNGRVTKNQKDGFEQRTVQKKVIVNGLGATKQNQFFIQVCVSLTVVLGSTQCSLNISCLYLYLDW